MRIINIISVLLAALTLWFVAAKCCIYTALALFLLLSAVGGTPAICVGEVTGEDHYHAWVQIGDVSIEQSTLNLYHSPTVDYGAPDYMFADAGDFIAAVDMSSPIL